jgi:hypothetical protein
MRKAVPCVGVTAWRTLIEHGKLIADRTVLRHGRCLDLWTAIGARDGRSMQTFKAMNRDIAANGIQAGDRQSVRLRRESDCSVLGVFLDGECG